MDNTAAVLGRRPRLLDSLRFVAETGQRQREKRGRSGREMSLPGTFLIVGPRRIVVNERASVIGTPMV